MNNFSELVREERPDYKVYNSGFDSLNSVELISLIIGQGRSTRAAMQQARQIVNICGGSLRDIAARRAEELQVVQGVDPKKAMTLQAAFELAKRIEREAAADRPSFRTAEDVWRYFRPIVGTADHEEAHVLLMNNNFKLIKAVKLSSGGLTETAVDVRIILREALVNNATTLTLIHNHPSGNPCPSRDDDRITATLKQACSTMRLYLIDHVVVTDSTYYSYSEEGKL